LFERKKRNIVTAKRARVYDALAVLTVIIVITLDQWTKYLVVENLSPPESKPAIPLIGQYLVIYYIQNRGVAFGLFANTIFLALLIIVAIGVIAYLYLRMLNSGPLAFKLIFGMIIGGALGNLLDRVHNGGYVVDFIFFRIPEIHYHFAIFNIADACISVGVFLLFVFILFGGLRRTGEDGTTQQSNPPTPNSGTLRSREQDVQS
jgi:signal peptidase II